jgi:predicted RNA binding protein YcfA (HicA-like mRNA interferase family)
MHKDVRELVRAIEKQGWRVEHGSGHLKAMSPDGETIVTLPTTPSGGRWRQNVISQLKRGGFRP